MSSNPYQTPEGQLTIDDQAVGEIKFFSPSSRINRLRYWAHSMIFTFVALALFVVVALVAAYVNVSVAIGLGAIVFIAMIASSYLLAIQRLHDLNKTGWMCLLMLVPFANIYLIVLLIFFEGTKGRNDFGLQTPPNKTWHWIMAFSMPVFVILFGLILSAGMVFYNQHFNPVIDDNNEYEQSQSETYPPEYSEDGGIDDTLFSDEALEDGVSYETPAEEEIIDDAIDDAEAEVSDEVESLETETPQ